jgi:hypothetical protein
MDGWSGWIDGWVDRQVDGWVDRQVDGWVGGWMNGRVVDELMGG